jgi:uncharacterized protein (UPF0333 family)
MNFNRKGQAAMEFLMTYGWAILIAIIAIAALIAFGVLNPPVQEVCGTSGVLITGLSCVKAIPTANGNMSIQVTNNLQQKIDYQDMTFTILSPGSATCNFAAGEISPGATATITSTAACVPNQAGKGMKGDLVFNYFFDDAASPMYPSGNIRIVQKIASA